ncbi:50S ribosomal protein L25 [Vibrio alginolyticus]|uniref:50S ribosomal protein L25 n=1 Tax=Vibrio alginolyticus TaxID=663 RepID=UPI00215C1F93|nr:50S ribosomal protein L25 [Vibrio alginolyticus]MCR9352111.1 50S ribosomal protein L25 [Vibrio alginolyticus]MCR9362546.1 50S ribosomal protein L25 [Vibrio alginolyticus]
MEQLTSFIRNDSGTTQCRRLRNEGKVPAIVYGKGRRNKAIYIEHKDLIRAELKGNLYNTVLILDIEGKKDRVIIKNVQRHPFKPFIQHVDFMYVKSTEELKTNVSVEVIGEEEINKKGLVQFKNISDLEVSCLPRDIPNDLKLDVSNMDIGEKITLGELVAPNGVKFLALESDDDAADWVVLSIGYPTETTEDSEDKTITED